MLEMIWITADKRRVPVRQMETSHITNCLRMMDRRKAKGKPWREQYRARLELELEIRNMGLKT